MILTVFWTLPTMRRADLKKSRKTMALDKDGVVGSGQEEGRPLTKATMQFGQ